MCASTLKSDIIEIFSTDLSSPSDKPFQGLCEIVEKPQSGVFEQGKN